jgi:hypothetical protein
MPLFEKDAEPEDSGSHDVELLRVELLPVLRHAG